MNNKANIEVSYVFSDSNGNYEFELTIKEIYETIHRQHKEIEMWKNKYKDMQNFANQMMGSVHELEKAQENG